MSEVPLSWVRAELGEIAETRLGKMLSAKARGGVSPRPYLRNKNVQWGHFDVSDLLAMDFDDKEFERFKVLPGDLLVCEGGEVGRAAIWRGQIDEVGYQKALHRIRPAPGVSAEYLLYVFRWFADTHAFESFVTGSTINHLPQEDLRRLPIPLPPQAEQRRVVAAIEEQFSRLDAADASLRQAQQRLLVLRGLLFRATTSSGYPTTALAKVAEIVSGQTPKGLEPLREGPIAFFKVGDMNAASGYEMARARAYLDDSLIAKFKLRVRPAGTVIFPKRGGAIATNKKRILLEPAVFDLNTMGLVPSEALVPKFLLYWLETKHLASLADGSNVPQINVPDVAPLEVPVPPPDEQQRVVEELEAQLSTLDASQQAIERAQRRSAALRRSILEQAFTGRLVSRDPSDEPASVLLERITAERAAAPKPSRQKRKISA